MEHRKSQSTVEPLALDENSSNDVTYVRENINQITKTNDDGSEYIMYEYDEYKYTKDEWEKEVLKRKNAELEEIINTMLGVSE